MARTAKRMRLRSAIYRRSSVQSPLEGGLPDDPSVAGRGRVPTGEIPSWAFSVPDAGSSDEAPRLPHRGALVHPMFAGGGLDSGPSEPSSLSRHTPRGLRHLGGGGHDS